MNDQKEQQFSFASKELTATIGCLIISFWGKVSLYDWGFNLQLQALEMDSNEKKIERIGSSYSYGFEGVLARDGLNYKERSFLCQE